MEPKHEFGKEAMENEQKRLAKNRKMKRTFLIVCLLVIGLGAGAYFLDDSGVFNSKNTKGKDKSAKEEMPVSGGISIQAKWDLPDELKEISGLAYLDDQRFACVQDEEGTVYIYNTANKAIERKIPFAGTGDFEGLALVDKTAWVVRSDGHLYEISGLSGEKPVVKEYDTPLTEQHNVEGLCYDAANNRLLLAIKDAEPGGENYKGIYAFDLATKKMPGEPAYKIDLDHSLLQDDKGKKKAGAIMPSAITIHPSTKELFITDGRKSKLLVLDNKGDVKQLYKLDKQSFAQPEGITFTPAGELFISNEGPKQPANILKVEISE